MGPSERNQATASGRRPPPPFRQAQVLRTERLSPRMCRITFHGPELEGLTVEQPAASVRVLLPPRPEGELVMPEWTGNEFLLPNGRRPMIRTLTPRRVDPDNLELDVQVVIHNDGAASEWAKAARPGNRAAVSGPARGYIIDEHAPSYLLAGDETAIPAISQLLEHLPAGKPVQVVIEVADPSARLMLPNSASATFNWLDLPASALPGEALVVAVCDSDLGPETRVWVAGEAAAVQRIRRHLFEQQGLPRAHAAVRGYWKHGRTGAAGPDD